MTKIVLSVCIPSYNRASCLKQCLASITDQFIDNSVREQVEIVVSDNASEDNTTQIVDTFKERFANVNYIRNSQNLGYDKNALQVIARAQGEYAWLLGDDDGLLPNSLKYLLPILGSRKYDYLQANGWGFDKSLENKAVSRPYLSLEHNLEYDHLSDYVNNIQDYSSLVGNFGGMSAQIFKRQPWLDLPNKESFIGLHIIHLFVILRGFKNLPCCVLSEPLYMGRSDNLRWEIFPGLETLTKRSGTTKKILVWILDEYGISYSRTKLNIFFIKGLFFDTLKTLIRKYILKSQKIRNIVKKLFRR